MWLPAAIATSAAVVASAPIIGHFRTLLRTIAGDWFPVLMMAAVVGIASAAGVVAVLRVRDRRRERYGALTAAGLVAVAYGVSMSTGMPEVDAVERFHFIEYLVITFLFYKAFHRTADGSVFLMPLLAGIIVATFDEWLQWFVPSRVGEVADVLLNLIAIGCALLFCIGWDPPPRLTLSLSAPSRRRVALAGAAAIVVFGAFFQSVHLGHEIADRDAGVFRSRYTADQLATLAQQRSAEWRDDPPVTWHRFSREDQYFSEAVAHVQRRNQHWQDGNILAARHENLILEKYYAPVLDTPSYVSADGPRWTNEQRAHAHAQTGPGFMIYDSDALPYPVFTWSPWTFWTALAVLIGVLLRWLWLK